MATAQVSASDVLFLRNAPIEHSFRNRIIGFLALMGIGIDIIYFPPVLGIGALAGASFTDLQLFSLFALALLAGAVSNMTNDINDAERDKTKWPLRPLATGLISRTEAVVYMAILSVIGIVIAIVVFNWLFLTLGLVVLVLNYVYAHYMRKTIGYLTVIVPMALLPAAIWSAFSPETVLTPLPWVIVIFAAAIGTANAITHEGLDPTIPALFVRPRPTTERALYVVAVIVMFLFGVAIAVYAQLSWLFVVALAVLTAWLLNQAKYLGENRSREKLETAFRITGISNLFYWLFVALFVWIK